MSALYALYEQALDKLGVQGPFKGNHKHHWCEVKVPTLHYLLSDSTLITIIHGVGEGINILGTFLHVLMLMT